MTSWLKNPYDYIEQYEDARVEDFFLMQTPIYTAIICAAYFCFVKYFGPRWMANKEAFQLKSIIAAYDAFQVIFNAFLFYHAVDMWTRYYGWGLGCHPVQPTVTEQRPGDIMWAARLVHLYYLNKIIDLLDTIFFVLRKKDKKISTLHVFHHTIMPIGIWHGVKYTPGGNILFVGIPNVFVHVWMYTYYLVALLGPQYQKYIWWKRHLTEMQLIQFGMVALYIGYLSCVCDVSKHLMALIIFLDTIFIYLFIKFYVKAYKRTPKNKDEKRPKVE